MNYSGKHILVLGLGRSGLAATRLLQHAGAIITVADSGTNTALEERASLLRKEGIIVHLGSSMLDDRSFYECAILSPGIEITTPLVKHVLAQGIPLVGELELAYGFCKCPIVAITGSNGKTTTTELVTAGLQSAGLRALACGNIGLPFSEAVLQSAFLDVMIIEVSSFQLETTDQFHATIAVWLNLTANHLDRYESMAEYRAAKLRVFRHQQSSDVMVVPKNFDDTGLPRRLASLLTFSSEEEDGDFYYDGNTIFHHKEPLLNMKQTQLRGAHNAENIMAALAIGIALGVAPKSMMKGLSCYRSLPHRCEIVSEEGGVTWINDSKATTLDAMEKAIQSIDKERAIILIAGGKNKGFSFSPIFPLVQQRVKEAILLGEMQEQIAASWKGVPSHSASTMQEAVALAYARALPGDVILLSPGTSSYDMFSNYEERGAIFKQSVHEFLAHTLPIS